jgi:hypothetical protein
MESMSTMLKVTKSILIHRKLYSILLFMIVNDLRQVDDFLRVFWFPLLIVTTDRYDIAEILLKVVLKTQ